MILFRSVELNGFRNIKHAKLEDLRNLNILIGPNNCGKTNFLEFIAGLSNKLIWGVSCLCGQCNSFIQTTTHGCLGLSLSPDDFYMRDPNKKMEVKLLLNEEHVDRLVPNVMAGQRKLLPEIGCNFVKEEIVMKQTSEGSTYLNPEHWSPFIQKDIVTKVVGSVLYCPSLRLQSYRNKELADYVRERRLTLKQKRNWIDFLQKIVDPRINDERNENLIIKDHGEYFEAEISKQGSGVKSLACLAADILSSPDKKVILIDEPELGLNPFVKQEFLKFLLDESKEKQIFIATQDPTFVNPTLWKNDEVAVYFYSVIDEKFVRIDLGQNQEDPNTFAGYLPHTVSLRDIHIYVEGSSDAYIFQVLLQKYLRKTLEKWFEILCKVEIYHLCGGFWKHLLYTIPKPPYKCIIILDGDKREEAKKICEKYNNAGVVAPRFVFCEKIEDIGRALSKEVHPIYCLRERCIEKYIAPGFDCTNPPQDYDKKVDGPKKAEELPEIPDEIGQLFDRILGTLGRGRDSPNVFP
jgi:ABC-type uncharacterized transport system ATPase subunit